MGSPPGRSGAIDCHMDGMPQLQAPARAMRLGCPGGSMVGDASHQCRTDGKPLSQKRRRASGSGFASVAGGSVGLATHWRRSDKPVRLLVRRFAWTAAAWQAHARMRLAREQGDTHGSVLQLRDTVVADGNARTSAIGRPDALTPP